MRHRPPACSRIPAVAIAAALLLGAVSAWAARVELRVDRPRIAEDDQLTVRVIARGDYDEIVPPRSDGFDFESAGRSQQVSIIGSRMQRSDTFTYIGRPRRVGKHMIEAAILRRGGRVVARSRAVTIEVTSAREALGRALAPGEAMNPRRFTGEPFFVRPQLSTARPYVGQPFVLQYELFWSRRVQVSGIRELGGPKYGGFEVEDLLDGKPQEQEPARFAGRPYFRQVTRKVLLTAAAPGTLEVLGPRYRVQAGDIFTTRAYKVGPPPIAIAVREVPTRERPASYVEGHVGRLEIDGWLLDRDRPVRRRSAKVGERVVLHLEVRGSGNLYGIPDLHPAASPGMRLEPLPGRGDEQIKVSANGVEGKRVWQFIATAEKPGTFAIPGLEFTAFDPYDERFKTSSTGPFVIEVAGVPGATTGGPSSSASSGSFAGVRASAEARPVERPSIGAPPPDIAPFAALRPIAARARIAGPRPADLSAKPWFWRMAGLPWALALLLVVGRFAAGLRARGGDKRRVTGALSRAERAIDRAGSEGGEQAYSELRAAAADFLQVRAHLNLKGLTRAALRRELAAQGGDDRASRTLVELLEHFDFARYAPTDDRSADLALAVADLKKALARLDRSLARDTGSSAKAAIPVLLACVAIAAPQPLRAATLEEGFAAANKAYVARDWERARRGYEQLLRHHLRAAAVHYNLGNTLVRLGRLGEAVGHYTQALRLEPGEDLEADILANLRLTRRQLSERARRRHRILHIFDESAAADVAFARAAPRNALAIASLVAGLVAVLSLALLLWPHLPGGRLLPRRAALALALIVHLGALGWLMQAHDVDATVRHGIVIREDAPMSPCVGVGEDIDLPEGLEVRMLRTRPDGRVQVRLPNGRSGCMRAKALYSVSSASISSARP